MPVDHVLCAFTAKCGLKMFSARLGHTVSSVGNNDIIIVYILLLLWCIFYVCLPALLQTAVLYICRFQWHRSQSSSAHVTAAASS